MNCGNQVAENGRGKKSGCYGCSYRHCSKLFSKMRRETKFRQHRCQNCKKSMREKKVE